MPKSQSMSRPVFSNDEQLNELSSSVVRHQIDASEVHAARPLGVSFRAKNLDSSDGPGGHDPGTVLVARAVSDDGRFDVSDCAVRRSGRTSPQAKVANVVRDQGLTVRVGSRRRRVADVVSRLGPSPDAAI